MHMKKLIRFDWAIKYILKNKANFEILNGFLSELLGTKISIKSVLDGESNKIDANDKFNRVDLLVENENSEKIIIEVQCERQLDYLSRILYGTSKAITEYICEGDKYRQICKVISVSVVFFKLGIGGDYIYKGTTDFKGIHNHEELRFAPDEQEIYKENHVKPEDLQPRDIFPEYYIIKVDQFQEKIKSKFDEWVYFLKHSEVKSSFKAKGIKSAAEKLDILKLNKAQRAEYDSFVKDRLHENSMIDSHYGRGKREGEKKGLIKGEAIGIKKGIEKEQLAIVINMKEKGYEIKTIMEITGLSKRQIDKLLTKAKDGKK